MSLIVGTVYTYDCGWILNPHPKSGIVVSRKASWILWFNSDPRFHGIAQMPIKKGDHKVCVKDCYLDLSAVQIVRAEEAKIAIDEGAISEALLRKLLAGLNQPNRLITKFQRDIIIGNLTPLLPPEPS
jgi:hypothetical protein